MKNKGFFKTAAALLAALVLLGGFSVTAYAGGGEDIPTNDSGVIVETEPQPLTPDGNLSLIDDIEGEAAEDKQFIIVQSKNGNYFYIIVDRAAEGENTVHFLNQVDEADLMALMEGDSGKAQAYVQMMSIPTEEQLNASVQQAMQGMTRADMESAMTQGMAQQMSMSESDIQSYLASMSDDEIKDTFTQMMQQQVKTQYAQQVQEQMASMQPAELIGALTQTLPTLSAEQCALYYDEMIQFSDSTYDDNLKALGDVDLDDPASINLYAATFEDKDVIEDAISDYNEGKDEMSQIQYTDYVGLMMSSVTKIINELLRKGADVIFQDTHVSGHACQEDLKLIYSLVHPKFAIPVHGEFRHRMAQKELAEYMGVQKGNALLVNSGDVVSLDEDSCQVTDHVACGAILVDGLGVGDVGNIVLRDRQNLAQNGIIVVVLTLEKHSNQLLSGPDIVSRGFVYVRESEDLLEEAHNVVADAVADCLDRHVSDWGKIKNIIKDSLSDFLWKRMKRNPMILPIIMEV